MKSVKEKRGGQLRFFIWWKDEREKQIFMSFPRTRESSIQLCSLDPRFRGGDSFIGFRIDKFHGFKRLRQSQLSGGYRRKFH